MTSPKRQLRTQRKALVARQKAWGSNRIRQEVNRIQRAQRMGQFLQSADGQIHITLGLMTNWQRNQAGKACKGDFRRVPLEKLVEFSNLPHHKAARA
jgi:hypothetical protein